VGKDGGQAGDDFLTNPAMCHADLKKLVCKPGADNGRCLSGKQIASFGKIYGGPRNPRTGQSYEAGFAPGSELGWSLFTGKTNPANAERPWAGFFADIVYADPDYLSGMKYLKFDFDGDYAAMTDKTYAGEQLGSAFGSDIGRSLDPVRAEGGKIIAYHGWDDGDAPAPVSVQMYKDMVAKEARLHHLTPASALALTRQFYRLFMVPGLGHCRGGSGPWDVGQVPHKPVSGDSEHDMLTALEKWVELGAPPDRFIGVRADPQTKAVNMTRPVCPYPAVAHWNGAGSKADAANFRCDSAR
jgi:feruloyl esterase